MGVVAQGLGWLDAMVGIIRCARCSTPYVRQDLAVVAERDGYVFVRCVCRKCGGESVAIVMLELAAVRAPATGRSRAPFTVDDVLAAHELLREHRGGVETLFSPPEDRRPR